MINTYDVPVESIVHETSVDFVNDNKYRSINLKKIFYFLHNMINLYLLLK